MGSKEFINLNIQPDKMVSPIGRVCFIHLFVLSLTIVLGTSSLVANNSFSSRVWAYENPDSYVSTLPSNIVPIKDNKKNDKECEPGVGKLKKDQNLDELCNPGLENLKSKDTAESTSQKEQDNGNDEKKKGQNDEQKQDKLTSKIEKKEQKLEDRIAHLESILSEEDEKGKPISEERKKELAAQDEKSIAEHESETDEECRDGNVLDGASNEEDLNVIRECEEAEGEVMHTKNMDDGDYKFLLKLDDQYEFLLNDGNEDDTDGFLVVEVVPKDRDSTFLPDEGDRVHVFGAWVTDEPKGWREIHPAWSIEKQ